MRHYEPKRRWPRKWWAARRFAQAEVHAEPAQPLRAAAQLVTGEAVLHTATRLADGRVMVAGGLDASNPIRYASCELFTP